MDSRTLARLSVTLLIAFLCGIGCEDSGGGAPSIPGTFSVPANTEDGVLVTAPEAGTYLFTITGGSYSFYADIDEWLSVLVAYRNRPAVFGAGGRDTSPVNADYTLGPYSPQPTPEAAAATGVGARIRVPLNAGEYLRLLVPDSQGFFGDNRGRMSVFVEQEP
jgi:hypothetical protein